ncbi:alpha/beta fold hydrolase [Actinophytocola sediminis]
MSAFSSYDGTELAYHVRGAGEPLVCVPGGPGLDAGYLADLGGLSDRFQLVLLDNRGTGQSSVPADPATYRCDRLVDDLEALREHLGLDQLNLLGHSAGANIVVSYVARHPDRVGRLVLVNPGVRAIGVDITTADRREIIARRAEEPWYTTASAAFERINAGEPTAADLAALAPVNYGRWDDETRAHHASGERLRNNEAAAAFGTDGAFRPAETRAALATFPAPVLVLAGEVDANSPLSAVAELAGLFPNATLAALPGGAHFAWLDDPVWITTTVASFWATPLRGRV